MTNNFSCCCQYATNVNNVLFIISPTDSFVCVCVFRFPRRTIYSEHFQCENLSETLMTMTIAFTYFAVVIHFVMLSFVLMWIADASNDCGIRFRRTINGLDTYDSTDLQLKRLFRNRFRCSTYLFQTHFQPAGAASFSNCIRSDDTLFSHDNKYCECNACSVCASMSV